MIKSFTNSGYKVSRIIITSTSLLLLFLLFSCGTTSPSVTENQTPDPEIKTASPDQKKAPPKKLLDLPDNDAYSNISINLSHFGTLTELLVTGNSRYAVSSSKDSTIKIWDIRNRRHIRTLTGNNKDVRDIVLSPDEKHLYSASKDKSIRIWNFETGNLQKTFNNAADQINTIEQGRNESEIFISVYKDNGFTGVYAFDLSTGKKEVFLDGTAHYCVNFFFSKDGKYAYSNYEENPGSAKTVKEIAVWSLEKREIIKRYKSDSGILTKIRASDDNRYIAATDSKTRLFIWDRDLKRTTYAEDYEFPQFNNITDMEFNRDSTQLYLTTQHGFFVLYKNKNGRFCSSFEGRAKSKYKVQFPVICPLPETSEILVMRDQLYLYNSGKHGNVDKKYTFSAENSAAWGGTYSEGSDYFISDHDSGWALWNMEEGLKETEIRPAPAEAKWLSKEAYHKQTGRAVSSKKGIVYWNSETGRVLKHLPYRGEFLTDLKFTSDGSQVLCGYRDGIIRFWDLDKGTVCKEINSGMKKIIDMDFSSDGKMLTAVSLYKEIKVWDLESGEIIHEGKLYDEPYTVRFSPDNESIYLNAGATAYRYSYKNNKNSLASRQDIRAIKTFEGHSMRIESLEISPDGSRLVTLGKDKSFAVWDTYTGKQLYQKALTYKAENAFFSEDGIRLHVAVKDGIFRLYETETGKLITSSFSGPGREALTWTPDGYFAGEGQIVNRAVTLTHGLGNYAIDQFAVFKNRPDIIMERRGSSNTALKEEYFRHYLKRLINYRLLPENIPQDRWDAVLKTADTGEKALLDKYYREGNLLADYRSQNDIPLKDRYRLLTIPSYLEYLEDYYNTGLHTPEGNISSITRTDKSGNKNRNGKYVNLKIDFSDSKYDLKSYNIFVNGVPVFGLQGKSISEGYKQLSLSETVPLTRGENRIEVSCFNSRMTESYRVPHNINLVSEEMGTFYFIGFGVSEYRSPDIGNLKYADDDILDLEKLFLSLKPSYRNVKTLTLVNSNVTAESIRRAKDFIKDAGVNDTLVVAAAGHGLHADDVNSTYYFLTSDTDLSNLENTAADFSWIEELLTGNSISSPRKKLLLLDTCQSGDFAPWMDSGFSGLAALNSNSRGIHARSIIPEGKAKSRGLVVRKKQITWTIDEGRYILNDLSRRSGTVVFSSCRGNEFSYEDDELENGYFTSSFLSAFKTLKSSEGKSSDSSNEKSSASENSNSIDLRNLIDAVKKDVNSKIPVQTPTVDKDNMHMNFSFQLP